MAAQQQVGFDLSAEFEKQIAGLSLEDQAKIRWQVRRAAAARASVERFFEYVIREEITQQPVAVVPHQSVFFKFREAHKRCVIRMPVGFSKTFSTATYLLHGIGHDPFMRAAVISSTLEQAQKPVSMVRFYIEESAELKLVFPKLRPTQRDGEAWTQTKLFVDRPGILRDATLTAVGQDSGRLPGSRLKWIGVDDILSRENSQTEAQRKSVIDWFGGEVLSRLDKEDARCCVTNTPRDPKDLTYFLEKERGWPTMTMDCFGDIHFSNTDFDCDDIRPTCRVDTATLSDPCRLVANDSYPLVVEALTVADPPAAQRLIEQPPAVVKDSLEVVPLWPARWSLAALNEDRAKANSLREWNQTMRCVATSDDSSRVKREWIERGQRLGRDLGHSRVVPSWDRGNCFTGVDLAIGRGKQHDFTVFFTIYIDELGRRWILDVDIGRWTGKEILDRLSLKHQRFGSIIRIETNAAQLWMKEFALEVDPGLPIRSHNTGKNKTDPNFGLEMVFSDLENGLFVIPSGDKNVDRWIDDCFQYDPDKHTPDTLMALWLAREQARKSGALSKARAAARGVKTDLGGLMAR